MNATACPVCGATGLEDLGTVSGTVLRRAFAFCRCQACSFVFVANPSLDYEAIYSEDYYNGRGVDAKLNYVGEVEHPDRTVRRYEWQGVLERVRALRPAPEGTAWLDYGCGTGGLVHHLRARGIDAVGFEQGWCVDLLRRRGTPLVEEGSFAAQQGRFDVVSAIEVIEHTVDPVAVLRNIRPMLKPGGVLFLTTGNAEPFRNRITSWRYVAPEVHVSYFEPATLALALRQAGFEPAFPGFGPGWDGIIRYKLLMTLHRKWSSPLEAVVPWGAAARLVDGRLKLSAQPVGWARE